MIKIWVLTVQGREDFQVVWLVIMLTDCQSLVWTHWSWDKLLWFTTDTLINLRHLISSGWFDSKCQSFNRMSAGQETLQHYCTANSWFESKMLHNYHSVILRWSNLQTQHGGILNVCYRAVWQHISITF